MKAGDIEIILGPYKYRLAVSNYDSLGAGVAERPKAAGSRSEGPGSPPHVRPVVPYGTRGFESRPRRQ